MTLTKPLYEQRHPGEFIITEANGRMSRDKITVVAGSGVIVPGHVLGQLTTSDEGWGKFKPSEMEASGSDGAQEACAIAIYGCDATSVDCVIAAITRDAEVNGNTLTYSEAITTADQRSEKIAQLRTNSKIIVRGDIGSPPNTYPDR
jgi:Bacteriophage lambda head decoration protein D